MAKKYDTKDLDRKLIKKNKELQLERNFSENLMETASAMVIILDRKGTIRNSTRKNSKCYEHFQTRYPSR